MGSSKGNLKLTLLASKLMMHLSIFSLIFVVVNFNIICSADDKYLYFVDETCNEIDGFVDAIEEALELTKSATTRLKSDTDTDFRAVFEMIFKSSKRHTNTKNTVLGEEYNSF